MPGGPWGVRSIPEIDSRYPLWDQPRLQLDVDEGRFYLPDAEEEKRETLVTTAIDAKPTQCLRLPGNTFLPLWAAVFTAGLFIFSTFHWWWPALLSGVAALGAIVAWLWTGTSLVPEKPAKNVGLGLTLPLYASGPSSVGWWAMLITVLGDLAGFLSLIFGYFFYWTIHPEFPPAGIAGPGILWPSIAAALLLGAWGFTVLARRANRLDAGLTFHLALAVAIALGAAGAAALVAAPRVSGLDPTQHVYSAIVWVLVVWIAVHVGVGIVMQLYCLARRMAGRLTARLEIDIVNVTLYWHFVAFSAAIAIAVIAAFPLVS
jgi:cytochrome c oxidase subunit I+III